MDNRELRVLICGKEAGTIWRDTAGKLEFSYAVDYEGVPLSVSMPLSNRTYPDPVIRPYLLGLLPDSDAQKVAIAREWGVRWNDPVDLLACIGLDCPGAVQLCTPDEVSGALAREGSYEELSDAQIAARLRAIRTDADATWMGSAEHWSLGGNQGKFALARMHGAWCECRGSAATTHIFKNGVNGLKLQALNEFICMKAAYFAGLPAAHVEYRSFEGEPAIIAGRYDRVIADAGTVRLHQEDLCQALGVDPQHKYTADGGPTARDVLDLLKRTSAPVQNSLLFTRMLFFNCLIGAPDAHAKNYSLLLGSDGEALLAPLYDVASGLPYEGMMRKGRLAMSIGGENRFGRVGRGAVERYERVLDPESLGLSCGFCVDLMREMAETVPAAMVRAFDDAEEVGMSGARELRGRMEGPITESCAAIKAIL